MTAEVNAGVCRNCAGSIPHFHLTANGYDLDRCDACGFVQVRHIPDNNTIRAIYANSYFEKPKYVDDRAARHEFDRRLNLLKQQGLASSWRVLDYGCAAGDFVAGIAGSCQAWGVDYSVEAIAKARLAHSALADRFAVLSALPAESQFEAIVMWDVIEHVPFPSEALASIAGHLSPGGRLIVSTPNIGAPIAGAMGRRWAFMTPPEHLGFFDRQSMTVAMDQAGLDIVDWSSKGKLVNLAFLLYKAGRVFPALVPTWLWQFFRRSWLSGLCLYVPSGDIQYAVCRKRG